MEQKQEPKQEPRISFVIPRCCLEGWATCPHALGNKNKQKKKKKNIGL